MSLSDVGSSLAGFVLTNGGLKLLKEWNSVVRLNENPKDGKVKLLSGGGSGHEPAHVGYVGQGMLSGAVCGQIFSSPPVAAILGCLKMVIDQDGRAIFIVKNYTGDRLNFGIALELARRTYGVQNVRMLLVGEDCSIEDEKVRKSVGKRGLAGVVLVHKILGAMADRGMSIDDIYQFGQGLVAKQNLATVGFTFALKDGALENIEIGKGIHGEPGVFTMHTCKDFEEIIVFITDKLVASVPKSTEVVLLVNNLGGTSEFLMSIFLSAFLDKIEGVYDVKRIYCDAFLTSLNQTGISVTVMNNGYSPNLLDYLDHEVNVPSTLFGSVSRFALPKSTVENVTGSKPLELTVNTDGSPKYSEFGRKLASTIIQFVCEALISCKSMLDTMDKETGDGDTGTTIKKGAEAILQHLQAKELDVMSPGALLQQIGLLLQQSMGGSSGALYCLLFQGAASVFIDKAETSETIGIQQWSQALKNGNDKIVEYALTQVGDRTMLDALREGEKRLQDAITQKLSVLECVEYFTKGCEEAARATQHMVPKSGRAAYSASSNTPKSYSYPDPGAHAVSIWARALFEACKQVIVE